MEAPDNPVDQVDFDNQTSDVSSLDDCSTSSLEDEEIRQFRLLCSIIDVEDDIFSWVIIIKYLSKLTGEMFVKMDDIRVLANDWQNLAKKFKICEDYLEVWSRKKFKGDTSNTTMKMKHESDSDSDDNRKKKKRKKH